MDKTRIIYLLERYRKQELTDAERAELNMAAFTADEALMTGAFSELLLREAAQPHIVPLSELRASADAVTRVDKPDGYGLSENYSSTKNNIVPPVHRIHFLRAAWFRYAAVILLFLGIGSYFFYNSSKAPSSATTRISGSIPAIQPGGNKAILTLANGSAIILDSAANGQLAIQGNTKILKLNEGSLAYQAGIADGSIAHNTISTPKGGQYQITLPDGTKVWLNAASSITFPTAFIHDRKVTVSGEVYLEVAPDQTKPFYVKTGETEVQVLGTSFNLNAYSDGGVISTTLMEGSVKVSQIGQRLAQGLQSSLSVNAAPANAVVLKPGQQSQMIQPAAAQGTPGKRDKTALSPHSKTYSSSAIKVIDDVDLEKVMAWKNGLFNFEGVTLEEAMRQLQRWYDIEVIYKKGIPDIELSGEMTKGVTLNDLIIVLGKLGVHANLEGRKLIVLP